MNINNPCPECGQDLSKLNEYNIATHLGFKHDKWGFLEAWYESKGVPPQNRVHARLPLKDLLKPRFFERLWKCAICNEPVIYDHLLHKISCRCKTMNNLEQSKEDLKQHWTPTIVLEA